MLSFFYLPYEIRWVVLLKEVRKDFLKEEPDRHSEGASEGAFLKILIV